MMAVVQQAVKIDEQTGCWLWQRHRNKAGYGRLRYQKKYWLAHRFTYVAFNGPIPEDMELAHRCANPPCVSPEHNRPLDHRANLLEGSGFVAAQAAKSVCKNGHPLEGTNVYLWRNHRSCKLCRLTTWHRWAAKNRRKEKAL